MALDLQTVRQIALAFPGVEEGTSYGTPAFRIRGKLLLRVHHDNQSIIVKVNLDEREMLVETDPAVFFVLDHYKNGPWVQIRLTNAGGASVRRLFEQAWRDAAPKQLIKRFAGAR